MCDVKLVEDSSLMISTDLLTSMNLCLKQEENGKEAALSLKKRSLKKKKIMVEIRTERLESS